MEGLVLHLYLQSCFLRKAKNIVRQLFKNNLDLPIVIVKLYATHTGDFRSDTSFLMVTGHANACNSNKRVRHVVTI